MARFFLFTLLVIGLTSGLSAQVCISSDGALPDNSAQLEVKSSAKGFLPPRLTTAQRNDITVPAVGLTIFNTDIGCLEFFTGAGDGWNCPCPGSGEPDCGSLAILGQYRAGIVLDAANMLVIQLQVMIPGGFNVTTNFTNGYGFRARGTIASTGLNQLTLYGTGTPQYAGTDDFSLTIGGQTCYFQISVQTAQVPGYFRSGIFLHHSTGGNIWGPNGSSTSVPLQMTAYNTMHGYSGNAAVTMSEEWWSPGDNEWVTQHQFFEDPSPVTGIGYYLPGNPVIVIKSCFPSSSMSGPGQPSDTLNPWTKSLYNYKWHWRHIIDAMAAHPGNFFAIWTNAPLEQFSTNASEAYWSRQFCIWAKDTLAAGLDPVFGAFPPNVYVFDFFRKLTGPDGIMLSAYAAGPGDSHPNASATQLVAPQFVTEIFNAAIAYEALAPVVPTVPVTKVTRKE